VKLLNITDSLFDKTLVYYEFDQNNIADNGYPLNVFGIEQNFNFPTVYMAQGKLNKTNISIAEAEFARKKILLTKDVSQAYYEIQYLLNKNSIYHIIDSLYGYFYRSTELRYQEGDISNLDLLNAKAKQQQLRISVNKLKYDLEIAYRKLQAFMQYDSTFIVPRQELALVSVNEVNIESGSGAQIMKMQTEYQNARLKLERNRLMPDLSLGYFVGSNQYAGSKNYQGVQFGLGLPLFFGEQKSIIKANKVAISIRENLQEHYLSTIKAKQNELKSKLLKYQESLVFYNTSGKQLSEELIRSSQKSYQLGEIDFFEFAMSIENALTLNLDYIDNLAKYNQIALEINYLTK